MQLRQLWPLRSILRTVKKPESLQRRSIAGLLSPSRTHHGRLQTEQRDCVGMRLSSERIRTNVGPLRTYHQTLTSTEPSLRRSQRGVMGLKRVRLEVRQDKIRALYG